MKIMFNASTANTVEILDILSKQFNRYFTIVIFLFGIFGNICNCFVLSRPCLRSHSCAFLFLISSIANIISITSGLTTRILSGWNLDLTATNNFLCKFRVFIMFVSRTIAFWLIAFATIDRWFITCKQNKRRQISSLKNAQHAIMIIIILSTTFYYQVLYCYHANNLSAPLKCYGKTVTCRLLTDLTYALITILCPLGIMFVFGLLIISNVRQTYTIKLTKKRLINTNETNRKLFQTTILQQRRRKRLDRDLRHALFIQIIFLTILTIPQVIEKWYTTLTMNQTRTLLHKTIHNFIYNFVLLLTYLASGLPFYIYTLCGGSLFRNTVLGLIHKTFYSSTLSRTNS